MTGEAPTALDLSLAPGGEIVIAATAAISSLGDGEAALGIAPVGESPRTAIAPCPRLAAAGLSHPYAARVRSGDAAEEELGRDADPATVLLVRTFRQLFRALDDSLPQWRELRLGLAIGTSSGGMHSACSVFDRVLRGDAVEPALVRSALYGGPVADALECLGIEASPAALILGACASSTLAIGIASGWLIDDRCDLAIAGGFDAVTLFVAAGFECLRATTASIPPRPFSTERDGMSLGEGAALLALSRRALAPRARLVVAGFGASADAVHVTAPDPTGDGLARAAEAALAAAGRAPVDVGLVSAHATATPFNDAAEAKTIARVAPRAKVHAAKAHLGHTLGAAGALEGLAVARGMERGIAPGNVVVSAIDPALGVDLPDRSAAAGEAIAVKLSAAFGGANAALVIEDRGRLRSAAGPAPRARAVYVGRASHVAVPGSPLELAAATIARAEKLARADRTTLLALSAALRVPRPDVSPARFGIMVGHSLGSHATNFAFYRRIVERGSRAAEPRRFPYTSPNVAAGELALALGLRGPNLAAGSGAHGGVEALALAVELVARGHADAMLVVAVDSGEDVARVFAGALGDATPDGAVALVVASTPLGYARVAAWETRWTRSPSATSGVGHEGLVPLAAPNPPPSVGARSSWGSAELILVPE